MPRLGLRCIRKIRNVITASAALAGYFDEIMLQWFYARVVKLVYTYALGAYAARRAGSSPVAGTTALTGAK